MQLSQQQAIAENFLSLQNVSMTKEELQIYIEQENALFSGKKNHDNGWTTVTSKKTKKKRNDSDLSESQDDIPLSYEEENIQPNNQNQNQYQNQNTLIVCKFYAQGNCTAGNTCRFYHGTISQQNQNQNINQKEQKQNFKQDNSMSSHQQNLNNNSETYSPVVNQNGFNEHQRQPINNMQNDQYGVQFNHNNFNRTENTDQYLLHHSNSMMNNQNGRHMINSSVNRQENVALQEQQMLNNYYSTQQINQENKRNNTIQNHRQKENTIQNEEINLKNIEQRNGSPPLKAITPPNSTPSSPEKNLDGSRRDSLSSSLFSFSSPFSAAFASGGMLDSETISIVEEVTKQTLGTERILNDENFNIQNLTTQQNPILNFQNQYPNSLEQQTQFDFINSDFSNFTLNEPQQQQQHYGNFQIPQFFENNGGFMVPDLQSMNSLETRFEQQYINNQQQQQNSQQNNINQTLNGFVIIDDNPTEFNSLPVEEQYLPNSQQRQPDQINSHQQQLQYQKKEQKNDYEILEKQNEEYLNQQQQQNLKILEEQEQLKKQEEFAYQQQIYQQQQQIQDDQTKKEENEKQAGGSPPVFSYAQIAQRTPVEEPEPEIKKPIQQKKKQTKQKTNNNNQNQNNSNNNQNQNQNSRQNNEKITQDSEDSEDDAIKASTLCQFFMQGICRYGENCRYLHGDICEFCEKPCLHPTNQEEREKHQNHCKEKQLVLKKIEESRDQDCGVCFENIVEKGNRFGILSHCNHAFCLPCIREWRGPDATAPMPTETIRRCPICRIQSHFVIPSSFMVEESDEKEALIEQYKENLAAIPCKYFNYGEGTCKFGNSCHYAHTYEDGSPAELTVRKYVGSDGDIKFHGQVKLSAFFDDESGEYYENHDFSSQEEEDSY